MALNITGFDPQLFFAVNTGVQATFFTIFTLPTFILCGVCLVALLFAKTIHLEMRVVLINIFGGYVTGVTVLYLGYPLRVKDSEVEFVFSRSEFPSCWF